MFCVLLVTPNTRFCELCVIKPDQFMIFIFRNMRKHARIVMKFLIELYKRFRQFALEFLLLLRC